jgi:hypothetical protein
MFDIKKTGDNKISWAFVPPPPTSCLAALCSVQVSCPRRQERGVGDAGLAVLGPRVLGGGADQGAPHSSRSVLHMEIIYF